MHIEKPDEVVKDNFLYGMFIFWIIQTALICIGIVLGILEMVDIGQTILSIGFYMDTTLFTLFIIWGFKRLVVNKNLFAVFIIVGAMDFILFSTAYRILIDAYPDPGFGQQLFEFLKLDYVGVGSLFQSLSQAITAILYANVGLFFFAIGLERQFQARLITKHIAAYGVTNLILSVYVFFVIFKPFLSLVFLILAFMKISRQRNIQWVQPAK